MTHRKKLLMFAPLAIVGFAIFLAIGGLVVRELWNWVLPPLFGWKSLTFWRALALLALCRILFGGFGMHGGPRSHLRQRMHRRWEAMTPEEQERLRHGLHGRCSGTQPAGDAP